MDSLSGQTYFGNAFQAGHQEASRFLVLLTSLLLRCLFAATGGFFVIDISRMNS